ncbi:ArsO family NAD(P)H-dependent flavin-containing monooxygenase [Lutimonas sp.]|uniref:ArsO family NAD(P)H-dependent flavin-containing monooxygenase n=1 Tax=Lutimonas sp. TaxID=1872403 RepID=UPI003D9B0FCD
MSKASEAKIFDTIIIGGGQAGLSVGYFMKKTDLDYLLLDNQTKSGGSWLQTWDSLNLFSPSKYSSLSGWQMPATQREYPTKDELLSYLSAYEKRYDFPIVRNTSVIQVSKKKDVFVIETNNGVLLCKSVVSATGTAMAPFVPAYPNSDRYKGKQIHSIDYRNTNGLRNKKVLIVGAGNSGAQILAEVSKVTTTKWVTLEPPVFLPEDIDGRYLFVQANNSYFNKKEAAYTENISLSNIVQIESVKEGLKNGVYKDYRPFKAFYDQGVIWSDDSKESFDLVIWCTGFRSNLGHLEKLGITHNNRITTENTGSIDVPGLWLVGYGNWTGFASATIYGVGKTAKHTVEEIISFFKKNSTQKNV